MVKRVVVQFPAGTSVPVCKYRSPGKQATKVFAPLVVPIVPSVLENVHVNVVPVSSNARLRNYLHSYMVEETSWEHTACKMQLLREY